VTVGAARQSLRFAFLSSNASWGGSEDLWSAAAAELAEQGHEVAALKSYLPRHEPRIARLAELGCPMTDLRRLPPVPQPLLALALKFSWPIYYAVPALRLPRALSRARPDLVVLSQGGNLDGLFYAERLLKRGIPYVLIVQKASPMYWPTDEQVPRLRRAYTQAVRCYFVSNHNRRITEEQLAAPLPNAEVVRNPFLVPWEAELPWPEDDGTLRLACVARLHPGEKGQQLILRLMASEKWRSRPVSVSFYGAGRHLEPLQTTARYLGLDNVRFAGFSREVSGDIWSSHHGLILPSLCEGLPLALVEAMLSGRVAVATDVAGNPEMVEDGKTGFLAAAPTDAALDEAMERAWQRRAEWPQIGRAAAARARELVPPDPGKSLAEKLVALVQGAQASDRAA
jgi:glycosyltransferase involved in cell wall biosynthesis